MISESVEDPERILAEVKTVSVRETTLEGESYRGRVTFYNIEVDNDKLWTVLEGVAAEIRSPGWYFHLVGEGRLYIVLPRVIMFAQNKDTEMAAIIEYAKNQGIHPEQLSLGRLFEDPYA